ncbi:MAG: hypothetical protein PHE27_07235 [Alphaproteobacteria bacterium]|nr:hypothetical protein [Alphaproteobacteria bacterium]
MKVIHFLAVALLSVFLASPVQAAELKSITGTDTDLGLLNVGDAGIITNAVVDGNKYGYVTGTLAANAQLNISYWSLYGGAMTSAFGSIANGSDLASVLSTGLTETASLSTLPVTVLADLTSSNAADVVIKNFSSQAITFIAYVTAGSIMASFGIYGVVSAVPLPAAGILFSSGLLGLCGYGARRRKLAK